MTLRNETLAAERVSVYREALSQLSTQTFETGKYFSSHLDDLGMVVMPLAGPEDRRPHLIVLARGIPVCPEVQDVPFGIIDHDGLISAGMTDYQGQCVVELPRGSYRVRFVAEVTQRLDAEIILRIDDESLLPLVEDVLDDPNAPATLQQEIKELLQVQLGVSRKASEVLGHIIVLVSEGESAIALTSLSESLVESGVGGWADTTWSQPSENHVLSASSGVTARSDRSGSVDRAIPTVVEFLSNGTHVRIETPVEQMPFGVGCLVGVDRNTDQAVGSKVFCARKGKARPHLRLAVVPVDEWIEENRALRVVYVPAMADKVSLRLFARFRQQIEGERQRIETDEGAGELRQSLDTLLEKLNWASETETDAHDDRPTPSLGASPLDVSLVCDLAAALDTPSPTSRQGRMGDDRGTDPWIDQGLFHFACPIEKAAFEFGVVLIAWCD